MHKYSESQIATDYSPIVQVKTMRENNDHACVYILCNPKLSINNVMLFPHGHRLSSQFHTIFFQGEAK